MQNHNRRVMRKPEVHTTSSINKNLRLSQMPKNKTSENQSPTKSPSADQPHTNQPPASVPPTNQQPANQASTNQLPTNQPSTVQPPPGEPNTTPFIVNQPATHTATTNQATTSVPPNTDSLPKKQKPDKQFCNCRNPDECPVENRCCLENVIYQAEVTNKNNQKADYIGMTTTSFKKRFSNHKKSFRHEDYQHETTLSTYIWNNELNPQPNIKWTILKKCHPYSPGSRSCTVCNEEKYFILKKYSKVSNLNKKTDIGNNCNHLRHQTFKFRKKKK